VKGVMWKRPNTSCYKLFKSYVVTDLRRIRNFGKATVYVERKITIWRQCEFFSIALVWR